MATVTSKVMSRAAASLTTSTVLYTVPSSTTAVVTEIVVTNTGAAGTFTLGMGPSAGQIPLAATVTIAAYDTTVIPLKQVLLTTNTITGGASAITIYFHISGVEIV